MVFKARNESFLKDRTVDITLRDVSLERLYSVLFVYFELYPDYNFVIIRKPKYYELNFKGWTKPGGC